MLGLIVTSALRIARTFFKNNTEIWPITCYHASVNEFPQDISSLR